MGILRPICLTTDAHNIYGVAVGGNYSTGADHDNRVVLIKSSSDPAFVTDVSWTVISTILASALYDISQSRGFEQCYIDNKGVFTYIDQNVFKTPTSPGSAGIQYSPTFPVNSNGNNTGVGGWKNVDIVSPYTWGPQSQSTTVFSVKDASGNNVVIHSWLDTLSNIEFGVMNSTTMQFIQGPTWSFSPAYSVIDVLFSLGTMYVLATNAVPAYAVSVLEVPFSSPSIAASAPTNISAFGPYEHLKNVPVNLTIYTILSGMYANTYYFIYRTNGTTDWLVTIDTFNATKPKTLVETQLSELVPTSQDTINILWVDVGGQNGGPAFAFVDRMDNQNESHYMGLHLNGPQIGQWQNLTYQVNVTDPLGTDTAPTPTGYIVYTFEPSPHANSVGPSTGLVIGLALMAVAVLVSVGLLFYWRRLDRIEQEQEDRAEKEKHDNDTTTVSQALMGTGPAQIDGKIIVSPDPPGVGPWAQQSVQPGLYYPGTSSTNPNFTNVHYPSTAIVTSASVQPSQQQFLLSSHPRPNIVQSNAYDGVLSVGATGVAATTGAVTDAGSLYSMSMANNATSSVSVVNSPYGESSSSSGSPAYSNSTPMVASNTPPVPLHTRPFQ